MAPVVDQNGMLRSPKRSVVAKELLPIIREFEVNRWLGGSSKQTQGSISSSRVGKREATQTEGTASHERTEGKSPHDPMTNK